MDMDRIFDRLAKAAKQSIGATDQQVEKGLMLHKKLFCCDTFGFLPNALSEQACDVLEDMTDNDASFETISMRSEALACALSTASDSSCRSMYEQAVKASGLNCTVLTVGSEKSLHHSIARISGYLYQFDQMRDFMVKAVKPSDIEQANAKGKLAVVCSTNCPPAQSGLQGGLEALHWIDVFYRLGIRVMHLTYNRRNWVGDGCLEPADAGLSLHGKEVVSHMNAIGLAVDTAHSGRRTTLDAAMASDVPILASHTACKSVYDYPRGKTDEEIKLIAQKGGLIGICAIGGFLAEKGELMDLLSHVAYAVDLVGPDHVSIGTDVAFSIPRPSKFSALAKRMPKLGIYHEDRWFGAWDHAPARDESDPIKRDSLSWANWPMYTVGLVMLGYCEEDIEKILGKNFLRVFDAVHRAKTQLA